MTFLLSSNKLGFVSTCGRKKVEKDKFVEFQIKMEYCASKNGL
jgi:hypothetical protein